VVKMMNKSGPRGKGVLPTFGPANYSEKKDDILVNIYTYIKKFKFIILMGTRSQRF
jgi:hypothetical protein